MNWLTLQEPAYESLPETSQVSVERLRALFSLTMHAARRLRHHLSSAIFAVAWRAAPALTCRPHPEGENLPNQMHQWPRHYHAGEHRHESVLYTPGKLCTTPRLDRDKNIDGPELRPSPTGREIPKAAPRPCVLQHDVCHLRCEPARIETMGLTSRTTSALWR